MRPPRIRPRVSSDVEDTVAWHESKREGLGLEFLDELDGLLLRIAATPLQFPIIESNVRRALLSRFPYAIYFFSAVEDEVEIIAVLHQRRQTEAWAKRI